jgi:hypothetical protein
MTMSAPTTQKMQETPLADGELEQVSGGIIGPNISRQRQLTALWLSAGFSSVWEMGTLNGGLHR